MSRQLTIGIPVPRRIQRQSSDGTISTADDPQATRAIFRKVQVPATVNRVVIGREPVKDDPSDMLIVLSHSTVSRQQLELVWRERDEDGRVPRHGGWVVVDLGSTNGTFINDGHGYGLRVLKDGTPILQLDTKLTVGGTHFVIYQS